MNGSCLRLIRLSKVHETYVVGSCLMLYKWHNVMISSFINSVPLSATNISGNPNLAIQCS